MASAQLTPVDASLIIQKAWRSHVDRQIFQFYKNLIGFHTQQLANSVVQSRQSNNDESLDTKANPRDKKNQLVTANSGQCASTIMKLICPKEAQFMDTAAGTHIRFRLASPSYTERYGAFPPAVYYKVYTHRPVVDLCATAPRDYTHAQNKVKLPMQRFNAVKENVIGIQNLTYQGEPGTEGWYRRFENNSWRPISDKMLLASLYTTPIPNFKPTVAERRRKRTIDRKRKRIAWLRKMYFSNDQAFTDDTLVEDAIESMSLAVNNKDNENPFPLKKHDVSDEIDDDDVQALIEWTCCLDYSEYNNYWAHLGTAGFPSIEILGEHNVARQKVTRPAGTSGGDSLTGSGFTLATNNIGSELGPIGGVDMMSDTAPAGLDYWTLDQLETS